MKCLILDISLSWIKILLHDTQHNNTQHNNTQHNGI
jgi:hypothetical protein